MRNSLNEHVRGRRSNRGDGHVKHADGAEVTGIPLTHVTLHGWFERISEFTDNRDSPCSSGQMTFLVSVNGLFKGQ